MPFSVRGLEHLPAGPCVMVVNHQSYLDGPVIAAALARPRTFVAKRELLDHWVPRIYLKSIGTAFVDRFDAQRGAEDTGRFTEAARAGASLIVFAEGTFRRMPGLLPFRMGAFMAAAQAGIPVVPVTIRGTRSALRADVWLFRHNRISVAFSEPIQPQGNDWGAAVRLRDAARAEILRRCAEPDLGEETFLPPRPDAPPAS
jgi:1-acyl-sn-glycerol-3-phosphate acyltransferase